MCRSDHKRLLYKYIGEVSYKDGLELQEKIHKEIVSGKTDYTGVLIFLYHNPVITTGKYGDESNLLLTKEQLEKAGVEYIRTTRGGDATYHGPGQLVCYPIINLKHIRLGVRRYIRTLENIIISYLDTVGIHAGLIEGLHGVWVENKKIASIGVRVRKHVTMHGFALNVTNDLSGFNYINPCGLEDAGITSVLELTGEDHDLPDCAEGMLDIIRENFGIEEIIETDFTAFKR